MPPPTDQRVLIRHQGRFSPSDSKTVNVVPFDVPDGVLALALAFDYRPRTSTAREKNAELLEAAFEIHTRRRRPSWSADELARQREVLGVERRASSLDNLLNVVLIDPEGRWRGRWDRNPSSASGELLLSHEHAARGFLAGALPAGRWTAAIECHGVFGTEDVTFELRVAARGAPTADEVRSLHAPVAAADAAPEGSDTTRPRRRGPGYYFGEMHSHTVHSDGKWELADLARRAHAVGADFLCLTDHNTVSGLLDPPEVPLALIPGMELTTFYGHHPLYGMKTMIPWHDGGRVLPLAETSKAARAHGATVGVAHPFVPGDPLCTGCRMVDGLDPRTFDLIEVWYRRWSSPGSDNSAAHALWNRYWSEGHRITAVAARDWHGKEQDAPFPSEMPFTGIWAEDGTTEAILEGLRRGRVIMSGGPIVDVRLEAEDGTSATIGETCRSARAPSVAVDVSRLDAPATLRVFRSGEPVTERELRSDASLRLDVADRPGFYRAELWAADLPRCITNHVVWERH